jgi:hypothetical protein
VQVIKYEYTWKEWEILHTQFQLKLIPPSGDSSVFRPGFRENSWHIHMNVFKFWNTYLLNYSMEQSPPWEANRFAASQEIPRILWNPKVH